RCEMCRGSKRRTLGCTRSLGPGQAQKRERERETWQRWRTSTSDLLALEPRIRVALARDRVRPSCPHHSQQRGEMLPAGRQPDQEPQRWDDHVPVYEAVFEPFTLQLARSAITTLGLIRGQSVLDVGAGCGGAALELAEQGLRVTAVDASSRMIERIGARAAERGLSIDARAMDGQALTFHDATFDAALSVLGIILFPDAALGLAQMRRVVRRGGLICVVTWTEPHNYELA